MICRQYSVSSQVNSTDKINYMSKLPEKFEDDFTVKIIQGTSPRALAKVIQGSIAAPFNLESAQSELQIAVAPVSEKLIASASLWRTAHDLAPNGTFYDRFQWLRGNVSRKWDTGSQFVGDEGKIRLQFEDVRKNLIYLNGFDYDISLDVNAPPFWSLGLRYAPNNVLGQVDLSINDGLPLYTPDEDEKGNPDYNEFVDKFLTPKRYSKKQRKAGVYIQHNLSWNLIEPSLKLDLNIMFGEDESYSSVSAFGYDTQLDEYIRVWGDGQTDGRPDFGNADAFNLSAEGKMSKEYYIKSLAGVLNFIPTETHG